MLVPVIGCVPCRGIGVVSAGGLTTCERCGGRGYHVPKLPVERPVRREPSLLAALVDSFTRWLTVRVRLWREP